MIYRIEDCMTELPHTIGRDASPDKAAQMMREYRCHHLPVLDGGQLVGMLSERDLQVATALDRSPKISDLMTEDPFVVQREADVKNVVKEMIDRRVDSAIVAARPGKPWGIFTQTDALRLLTKVL